MNQYKNEHFLIPIKEGDCDVLRKQQSAETKSLSHGYNVEACYEFWKDSSSNRFPRLKAIEEAINSIFSTGSILMAAGLSIPPGANELNSFVETLKML